MKDKIKEINILQSRIDKLKSFIDICKSGSSESKYKDNSGNLRKNSFMNLKLEAQVWTGTDTCNYESRLENTDDIALIVDFAIDAVNVQIEKLEKELESKLA